MTPASRALRPFVTAIAVLALLGAGCSDGEPSGTDHVDHDAASGMEKAPAGDFPTAGPERHTGPQGREGQFVVTCLYSHTDTDDPIVHHGRHGRSHSHDFYGAVSTDDASTATSLLDDDTTCDKPADTAAYWQPTLYRDDVAVVPTEIIAYYRAAPGVDPKAVEPYPLGLALIAGDATADTPQPGEATGWSCGASTKLSDEPPECGESAPLGMMLTFQDCWDGAHLEAVDFQSHATYSAGGVCPDTHPVHVPQLTVRIMYPVWGAVDGLRLASGNMYSAHGDFLNAWDPGGLRREVEGCIHRGAVCDLASNRDDDTSVVR